MEIVEKARAIKADAIFGRWKGVERSLTDPLEIPVVLRMGDKEYPDYPMLSGYYTEIGNMAAEFFYKHHFYNYAFFGYKGLIWSDKRRSGFEDTLKEKNMVVRCLYTDLSNPLNDAAVKQWLVSLPKPVALFAANDVLAAKISELCQETGIPIPDDLALLGVDNDEFLCNIACPTISSIHLDFERQGRELGATILRMRQEGIVPPVRIPVHPLNIRERESTPKFNIKDPYIRQIVDFIDTNYTAPISIKDIVRDIPLSRRAIEMRFKKEMAPETILSYLSRLRVREMCHLLNSTDMAVSLAAEKAGFTDVFNTGRTFKRFTGMSPAQYRKKTKGGSSGPADDGHPGNKEY